MTENVGQIGRGTLIKNHLDQVGAAPSRAVLAQARAVSIRARAGATPRGGIGPFVLTPLSPTPFRVSARRVEN